MGAGVVRPRGDDYGSGSNRRGAWTMKKLAGLIGFAAVAFAVSQARAQTPGAYGQAGCGLGSMLFGKDNSKLMQVLAATTNGIGGNQSFAIPSGTSNCTEAGVVKAEREQAA